MNQHSKIMRLMAIDGRDEAPCESRRDLLRRLAALGFVAAGGSVLSVLDAEAKGESRGKAKRKKHRKPPVLTIKPTGSGIYEVAVGAAIRFVPEHISAMTRDRIVYIVGCQLWEFEDSGDSTSKVDLNDGDDPLFDVPKKGAQTSYAYGFPGHPYNSSGVGAIPFIWHGLGPGCGKTPIGFRTSSPS